jgi:hypothetical protein
MKARDTGVCGRSRISLPCKAFGRCAARSKEEEGGKSRSNGSRKSFTHVFFPLFCILRYRVVTLYAKG